MGDAPTVAAVSPKLLELDKEDVNAVRSFLPGKILGRTAAVLALGVLCLRFHELFNVGIGQFIGFQLEPWWLKNTLLFGIPVLIVGAQIAAEWAAERNRRQSQALAIKMEAVPEGYFRIGACARQEGAVAIGASTARLSRSAAAEIAASALR